MTNRLDSNGSGLKLDKIGHFSQVLKPRLEKSHYTISLSFLLFYSMDFLKLGYCNAISSKTGTLQCNTLPYYMAELADGEKEYSGWFPELSEPRTAYGLISLICVLEKIFKRKHFGVQ